MVKNNIKNACLVVIGNEILTGRTQDKNINHIAKELFICGISLQLVVIIPDQKKFPNLPVSVYGSNCPKDYLDAINSIKGEQILERLNQII